ncbi:MULTISPECIES: hypothetical protein [Streptomyces violaceusniger group]|uniref:Uncharacterized protein n=2 Tax=Streptomyces rhizosphaericus TaxID=114699 RepID=A0ABN1S7A1_9ACTN|nr:hypothetical protein [Streptomyces indonesiensis]
MNAAGPGRAYASVPLPVSCSRIALGDGECPAVVRHGVVHAFRKVVAAAAVAGEPPFRGVLFGPATTARLAR